MQVRQHSGVVMCPAGSASSADPLCLQYLKNSRPKKHRTEQVGETPDEVQSATHPSRAIHLTAWHSPMSSNTQVCVAKACLPAPPLPCWRVPGPDHGALSTTPYQQNLSPSLSTILTQPLEQDWPGICQVPHCLLSWPIHPPSISSVVQASWLPQCQSLIFCFILATHNLLRNINHRHPQKWSPSFSLSFSLSLSLLPSFLPFLPSFLLIFVFCFVKQDLAM